MTNTAASFVICLSSPMRIVFLGPPGSGKGTQAQRLKDYLGLVHLSTGEMLREAYEAGTELGRRAYEYMHAGQLVPDELVTGIVTQRLGERDCNRGYILDGFPRTLAQARALDETLSEHSMPLDVVLSLQVPEEMLVDRLLARGRMDDNRETIEERFRQYNHLTQPLLDYYRKRGLLEPIEGEGTPDHVFTRVREAVDSVSRR
jgi:adenylate kinase